MTPRRASSFPTASAIVGPNVFSIGAGSSFELRAMITWPGPSAAQAHVFRPAPSNLGGACTVTLILAADTAVERTTAEIASTAPVSFMFITVAPARSKWMTPESALPSAAPRSRPHAARLQRESDALQPVRVGSRVAPGLTPVAPDVPPGAPVVPRGFPVGPRAAPAVLPACSGGIPERVGRSRDAPDRLRAGRRHR